LVIYLLNKTVDLMEAKELIDGYFASYPGVANYMSRVVEEAKHRGYVTTLLDRRRSLPDINSANAVVRGYAERNAINAPLQGSAADLIKIGPNAPGSKSVDQRYRRKCKL
jgi:DNA polymerase I-like protein with 3'-5' exonuclease and polymerase domains